MDSILPDARAIEDRAAAWLVRKDSGAWNASDQGELDRWLDASASHAVAYIRLATAWQEMQRLKSFGASVPPGEVPSPETWNLSHVYRRAAAESTVRSALSPKSALFAIAASVAIAVALTTSWYFWARGDRYQTAVGGLASVPMNDGSRITLNTNSEVRVRLSDSERQVTLERGEAFFDVAADPTRPFTVNAGSKTIIALGTAFSVRRNADDDVQVMVTEGRVRVAPQGSGEPAKVLTAGRVARARHEGLRVEDRPVQEVEEDLSWRTGYLVFREVPLADAVTEFNRYSSRRIVIQDAAIAGIRLSGKFSSTKYDAFVRLLEANFPIQADRSGDRIVLSSLETSPTLPSPAATPPSR